MSKRDFGLPKMDQLDGRISDVMDLAVAKTNAVTDVVVVVVVEAPIPLMGGRLHI